MKPRPIARTSNLLPIATVLAALFAAHATQGATQIRHRPLHLGQRHHCGMGSHLWRPL